MPTYEEHKEKAERSVVATETLRDRTESPFGYPGCAECGIQHSLLALLEKIEQLEKEGFPTKPAAAP